MSVREVTFIAQRLIGYPAKFLGGVVYVADFVPTQALQIPTIEYSCYSDKFVLETRREPPSS